MRERFLSNIALSNSGNIRATFGTTAVGNIPALFEHFISVFLALRKIYPILLKNMQLCEHQNIAMKQLSSRFGELSSSYYYSSIKSTRPFTFLWMNHQGSQVPCIACKITRSACKMSQSLLDHQMHVYQWRNDHLELIQWENDEFWKKINKQTFSKNIEKFHRANGKTVSACSSNEYESNQINLIEKKTN